MIEQPQFFWYKRYVAWQELLTLVGVVENLQLEWKELFLDKQIQFIESRILDAKVLDDWYEEKGQETGAGQSSQNE